MSKLQEMIIRNVVAGKIEKSVAVDLLAAMKQNAGKMEKLDIAIIGMDVRMPKAQNLSEYWGNLRNGVDCVVELNEARIKDMEGFISYYANVDKKDLQYIKAGFLDEIDKFDYQFFKLSHKEASLMDPHQRMFLEVAYNAIEDAGYGGDMLRGTDTGIYIGFSKLFSYSDLVALAEPEVAELSAAGNTTSIIASRLAYILDLHGPCLIIDTACSSSLVAVHMACQGLINGDCDQAIAGGVRIRFNNVVGSGSIGIEALDHRARTFDDDSTGTGWGEGVGAVVLKPLNKAIRDKDNIYAVIKGSAVNNDGNSLGILAPNVIAQRDVILNAWKNAGIDPLTISYIEAHGTGTTLGDPIEIDAINRAFANYTDRKQFCGVGSIKPNIGHLDSASGIASLIKAVLSIRNRELFPSINFNKPNKKICFEESPVYVNNKLKVWENGDTPLRCGVSSFGFSGTNCHVILEEAKLNNASAVNEESRINILAVSAKKEQVLLELVKRYYYYFTETNTDISDACYTASVCRGHYEYRIAVRFESKEELCTKLNRICFGEPAGFLGDGIFSNLLKESGGKKYPDMESYTAIEEIFDFCGEFNFYDKEKADMLCKYYINGGLIPWSVLYSKESRKKVSLPGYPFEKNRCWVNVDNIESKLNSRERTGSNEKFNINRSLSEIRWVENNKEHCYEVITGKNIIVFKDEFELGNKIISELEKNNNIIEVTSGSSFYKYSANHYSIDFNEASYAELFKDLKDMGIDSIIHLMSIHEEKKITGIAHLNAQLEKGVLSLFYLAKAIAAQTRTRDITIYIISNLGYEVTEEEAWISPANSMLYGLAKVISAEYLNIKCKCIDIDDISDTGSILRRIEASCNKFEMLAIRGGKEFIEEYRNVVADKVNKNVFNLKKNGTYIITGGMGSIGLEIARYLSKKENIRLILLGRSDNISTAMWRGDAVKQDLYKLKNKIDQVKAIEESGSEVIYYSVDISDEKNLATVLENIRNAYGEINGVVHGAGIAGSGMLMKKELETFVSVLKPKVFGALLLDSLTSEDKLDFFIMFSSTASLVGAAGQGDYTAANTFLDSFGYYRSKRGLCSQTINWTTWKEIGMAAEYGVNVDGLYKALPTETAVGLFELAVNTGMKRTIIGEINYSNEALVNNFNQFPIKFSSEIEARIKASCLGGDRKSDIVKIKGIQDIDKLSVEYEIALIWHNLLGVTELGLEDNFFELGGNSITAIKLEVELEKRNYKVTGEDIYKHQTLRELAAFIKKEVPVVMDNDSDTGAKESDKDTIPSGEGKYILEGIEPFNDIFYRTCFNNRLFSIADYYDRDPLMVIANDVMVYEYENTGSHFVDIGYIPILEMNKLMQEMEIRVDILQYPDNLMSRIKEALLTNKPVIIRVDCYYMPIRKDFYLKEHFDHNLLFYGYDDAAEEFHILEHKNRDSLIYEKCILSYEDTKKAYTGYMEHFYDSVNLPAYYEFSLVDSTKGYSNMDCTKMYLQNIMAKKDRIIKGLADLKHFIDDFSKIVTEDLIEMDNFEKYIMNLNNIVNGKLSQQYLVKRAIPQMEAANQCLSLIISDWIKIRGVIAKAIFSKRYKKEDMKILIVLLDEIYQNENLYMNHIEEVQNF